MYVHMLSYAHVRIDVCISRYQYVLMVCFIDLFFQVLPNQKVNPLRYLFVACSNRISWCISEAKVATTLREEMEVSSVSVAGASFWGCLKHWELRRYLP